MSAYNRGFKLLSIDQINMAVRRVKIITEDDEIFLDTFGERIKLMAERLPSLKPGDFVEEVYQGRNNPEEEMKKYVDSLADAGIDIGKGEKPEFGYRMPMPERGEKYRKLIIFRRR
jgi:hypothetical protein